MSKVRFVVTMGNMVCHWQAFNQEGVKFEKNGSPIRKGNYMTSGHSNQCLSWVVNHCMSIAKKEGWDNIEFKFEGKLH